MLQISMCWVLVWICFQSLLGKRQAGQLRGCTVRGRLLLKETTKHIRYVFCKYFLLVCVLSCHSLNIIFHRAEEFYFSEVQLVTSFMDDVFGMVPQKSLPNPRPSRFSPMLLPRSFVILQLTLMFFIHCELIFVKSNLCVNFFFACGC